MSRRRRDHVTQAHSHSNITHLCVTGGNILKMKDGTTPDGLKEVFATNVFGHYLLVSCPFIYHGDVLPW